MGKPWYRKSTDTWYFTDDGKQIALARGKDNQPEAEQRWHEIKAAGDVHSPRVEYGTIATAFLEWCKIHRPDSFAWYGRYISQFWKHVGSIAVEDLRKHHVTDWLDKSKITADATRRAAITALKRSLNWAVEEEILTHNPLAKLKRPTAGVRAITVDAEAVQRLLDLADRGKGKQYRRGAFRMFVLAMVSTGARPKEVRTVDASHYDPRGPAWVFPPKDNKTGEKTGKPRAIYLPPCINTLTRILIAARPEGPLFRNGEGNPWKANTIRCRVARLREKAGLPVGAVAYSLRHTFATEALVNGVGDQTLAVLMGHSSTEMIRKCYGHLDQRREHLVAAAQLGRAKPR